jgi:hypothetical protein
VLYVTALEILGEALRRHLGIKARTSGNANHRLRHFVAASVLMADVARGYLARHELAALDFSQVAYEKEEDVSEDGRSVVVFRKKGSNAPALRLLQLASRDHTPDAADVEAVRDYRAMCFWGQAAAGFCDNHRLSVIHRDNDFEFTELHSDGSMVLSRELDVRGTCDEYATAMRRIWGNLHDPWIVDFLARHARGAIEAFGPVLGTGTYPRRR